jgi:hypothetical protein
VDTDAIRYHECNAFPNDRSYALVLATTDACPFCGAVLRSGAGPVLPPADGVRPAAGGLPDVHDLRADTRGSDDHVPASPVEEPKT